MLEGSFFALVGGILQGERVPDAKGEKWRRKDTCDEISEEASERKSLIIYPEGDVAGDSGLNADGKGKGSEWLVLHQLQYSQVGPRTSD
jgi:hypothetical protein